MGSNETASHEALSEAAVATDDQLREMWQMLLAECHRYITETPPSEYQASYLEVIRRFLKDNNVTVDSSHIEDVRLSLAKLSGLDVPFDYQK